MQESSSESFAKSLRDSKENVAFWITDRNVLLPFAGGCQSERLLVDLKAVIPVDDQYTLRVFSAFNAAIAILPSSRVSVQEHGRGGKVVTIRGKNPTFDAMI